MSTEAQLYARERTYDLLARLYLREPDAAIVEYLRLLPGFEGALPAEHEAEAEAEKEWLEEHAVEHERLFGMNAYPYESLYAGRELMLNTHSAEQVTLLYKRYGFDASAYGTGAPDHLGVELACMGALARHERRATEEGNAPGKALAAEGQAHLLRAHLAAWSPVYALTLGRVARKPLYSLLASLTIEMALSNLASTTSFAVEDEVAEEPEREAPHRPTRAEAQRAGFEVDEESPLPFRPYDEGREEDEGPGLNRVVRRLITPVDVGVFLTRADIAAMGGSLDLPAPVGDRFQMLRGLFDSAGQFEQVPALLAALDALIAGSERAITALAEQYPEWESQAARWLQRAGRGRDMVAEMRGQAAGPIEAG